MRLHIQLYIHVPTLYTCTLKENTIWTIILEVPVKMYIYVTGFAKRDLFDKFSKIEFRSHLSATRIAPKQ